MPEPATSETNGSSTFETDAPTNVVDAATDIRERVSAWPSNGDLALFVTDSVYSGMYRIILIGEDSITVCNADLSLDPDDIDVHRWVSLGNSLDVTVNPRGVSDE